jgi:hypothetical protein
MLGEGVIDKLCGTNANVFWSDYIIDVTKYIVQRLTYNTCHPSVIRTTLEHDSDHPSWKLDPFINSAEAL